MSYRFGRVGNALTLERWLVYADREACLTESLVGHVGGLSSGRIVAPALSTTREDFAADAALGQHRRGTLDRAALRPLLSALADSGAELLLDGAPIEASGKPTGLNVRLTELSGGGFRLQGEMDPTITEVFSNSVALCGICLRPLQLAALTPAESAAVSREGEAFRSPREIARLVSEVLPSLERKVRVERLTDKLPEIRKAQPVLSLRLEEAANGGLRVIPSIEPFGVGGAASAKGGEILVPEPEAERALARRLQSELHLNPGQAVELRGAGAVELLNKLQSNPSAWPVQGDGLERFGIAPQPLSGRMLALLANGAARPGGDLELAFSVGDRRADPAQVLRAWRENEDFVPLLGGGFARLPQDWLNRFGERILRLLEARTHSPEKKLPAALLPELADLAVEADTSGAEALPPRLAELRERLRQVDSIPEAPLPTDINAELRHYQQQGVNWLCLLRDSHLGAMLADDMGLGKTLQALCAIRGRTLIVAPTSVLSSWSAQIAKFRPRARYSLYSGPARTIPAEPTILLTSYAVLRLDRDKLCAENWDTIVLDEAQNIKNPESQTARAAHSLRGDFRIALSGTPIENRMEDLWSQFQFINPGLLGERESFSAQNREQIAALRARVRPFILRRLKREVAPELPPRTEIVLHCELSPPEQELYQSLLASSRAEVLRTLAQGGGVMAALELLLRLRQACCSPSLVPGGASIRANGDQAPLPPSSKLSLLLETLEESISLGHRALVFSQWTGLLDLVEPRLRAANLSFSRLDGSTRDRADIVDQFQKPDGPSVMLISLKAGGVGLTLTAADHVFILDPWWNPAAEDQAADRAHRIGQENPVLVHRLVAQNTIEGRILAMQARKKELASAVLDGTGGAGALTRDDLLQLLAD